MSKQNGRQLTKDDREMSISSVQDMYKDYFLDYASYVILERAIPGLRDGLKPVQRRFLHSMKQMDDGRYHKVANIIGQTMQYHPHGDTSIGSALVHVGQKNLMIDTQGNWGDIRTGDPPAASRYIEARLSKFALEVGFNPQTTEWQMSYDGRKKEPINLPMKFPLLLAHGTEGIAVGLSTKVLPHNFNEIIKACIQWLKGRNQKIYPDFATGGTIDIANYNGGKRGGKVVIRAEIVEKNQKTLLVKDLPYGVTTSSLVDSILKANDKGKLKVKKVTDNTAQHVEIEIELIPGTSPTVMIDALYAFTDCQISISPNACVITDSKPEFLSVDEILRRSTDGTKELLRQELLIKEGELLEKLNFSSLEKIFIKNRIYHEIEECETWQAVLDTIDTELKIYIATPSTKKKSDKRTHLYRDLVEDDIIRLTEIKIKRISKYNKFKADEIINKYNEELKNVRQNLQHLTEYAIAYFENLMKKFGKDKERKTGFTTFDTIQQKDIVINNTKLWALYDEGFVGNSLKKNDGAEFICDCSSMDDVIAVSKDGSFTVTKIDEKTFIAKNLIYVNIWKKGDEHTTYSLIYRDGKSGKSFAKRFQIKSITRDKKYDLTGGNEGSHIHYFKAHLNGAAEVVNILLSSSAKARKKSFQYGFEDFGIKSRSAKGITLTKYPIRKVGIEEVGISTIGAQELFVDKVSGKLNTNNRGQTLGLFDTGDMILVIYLNGQYALYEIDFNRRFEMESILLIGKHQPEIIYNAVYYEGNKKWTMLKRFRIESFKLNEKIAFISDHSSSILLHINDLGRKPISYREKRKKKVLEKSIVPEEISQPKGWKALGNKLSDVKVYGIRIDTDNNAKEKIRDDDKSIKPGETIEFDVGSGQGLLFEDN